MISNTTKRFVIAKSFKLCNKPWSQARGLILSKPKVLVFEFSKPRRISLHMWFVFFPIDVTFLDEGKQVVDIKRRFMPFTFYKCPLKAKYVIETPVGMLKNTEKGDLLDWKT